MQTEQTAALLPCPFCGDDGEKGRQTVTQFRVNEENPIDYRTDANGHCRWNMAHPKATENVRFDRIICRCCGGMAPELNWQARAALATKPAGAGGAVDLTKYDPNIRWSKTTMALTYMMWDYSLTVEVSMGGNCKGFDLMDTAIETHAEQLFKEQGENPALMLTRPAQDGSPEDDTLECTPDDEDTERWLSRMCVGIRIVGHEETKS